MKPIARRGIVAAMVSGLVLLAAAAAPVATAAAPGGPYSGYAHGTVVHVDAITSGTTRLLDAEVGMSNAAVNSEGLTKVLNAYQRPIVPGGLGGKNSRGHSTILEVGVAHAPDAENQVKPWVAEANAAPSESMTKSVVDQSVATVAHVELLKNVARAKWNPDTCIIGEPISFGQQTAARLQVLEMGADESTAYFDEALVGLHAEAVGGVRAATTVTSIEQLFKGDGPGLGLQSVTSATLAPVTFLQGTANEFTIEVDGPAYLSSVADGTKGGAKVLFSVPLVSVIQGGVVTQALPGQPIDVALPNGIARIKVGVVEEKNEAGNGTSASAIANVVEVTILDLVANDLRGATIALGHLESGSKVPADGITCPIPVKKDANPRSVTAGEEFDMTITVENPFNCPLENVTLTDRITVEDDALFSILDTNPEADSATGGENLSSGSIKWSLGTIQPGKSKTVTATFLAQGGAGKIVDVATAEGVLGNCNAGPADAEKDVTALAKVKVPVDGRTRLVVPESRVLGGKTLPTTGVPLAAVGGLGMLAAAGATALVARRLRPVKR